MKKIFFLAMLLIAAIGLAMPAMAAKPGDTVTVNISVDANPNNACSGGIRFSFDRSALEFVKAEAVSSDVYVAPATANEDFPLVSFSGISVGVKGTITFRIKADARPGAYEVKASAIGFVDGNEKSVSVTVSGGTVTVEEEATSGRIPGDVNDDGEVDTMDTLLLDQYLADWDVSINMANADVNGDGEVDTMDTLLLDQYLADWDVELI